MEQTGTYRYKLETLTKAISGFREALEFDFTGKSDLEIDILKNGQIQKFEYCVELLWKTIKIFLFEIHGLDCYSPKSCVKLFFQTTTLSENDYEKVMEMLTCRNKLSHIFYEKSEFEAIHQKLFRYVPVFKHCLTLLKTIY